MKCISGVAAVAVVGGFLGVSIGLAGPASADPAPGAYTGNVIQSDEIEGSAPFTLTPCGPDCIHLVQTGKGWELHRQGNIWSETDARGAASLDENTLVFTLDPAGGGRTVIGLVKDA